MLKTCTGWVIATCAVLAGGCMADDSGLDSELEPPQLEASAIGETSDELQITGCPTTAPELFGPENLMYGPRPTFSWGAVPGATSYTLYVLDDANPSWWHRATGITGTSYTPSEDLPMHRQLRWKVKGEGDCAGPYASVGFLYLLTPAPCPPVDPPRMLSPSGPDQPARPLFSWTQSAGAIRYRLFILRLDDTFAVPPIDLSGLRYRLDVALPPGDYRAKVGIDSPCGRGPSSEPSIYFSIPAPPSCPRVGVPTTIYPGFVSTVRPTFTWAPVPGCTSYQVYVQQYAEPGDIVFGASSPTTSLLSPIDLPLGGVLRWKVKCDDACGAGPYSPIQPFFVR
jgi:hypothetical protein